MTNVIQKENVQFIEYLLNYINPTLILKHAATRGSLNIIRHFYDVIDEVMAKYLIDQITMSGDSMKIINYLLNLYPALINNSNINKWIDNRRTTLYYRRIPTTNDDIFKYLESLIK